MRNYVYEFASTGYEFAYTDVLLLLFPRSADTFPYNNLPPGTTSKNETPQIQQHISNISLVGLTECTIKLLSCRDHLKQSIARQLISNDARCADALAVKTKRYACVHSSIKNVSAENISDENISIEPFLDEIVSTNKISGPFFFPADFFMA